MGFSRVQQDSSMTLSQQLVTIGSQQLPVRNTFIHFDERPSSDPFDALFAGSGMQSAPPHMLDQPFKTKWPEHEQKHMRGECRPCAYYLKKADGCRQGAQCGFCHLCPEGELKARKKEKIRALREQQKLAKACANMMPDNLSKASTTSGSSTPSLSECGTLSFMSSWSR